MPIYRATMTGRTKPVLVRSENATKATAQLVSVKALTSDEMADALAAGEKVWTPGEDFPADAEAIADKAPAPTPDPIEVAGDNPVDKPADATEERKPDPGAAGKAMADNAKK